MKNEQKVPKVLYITLEFCHTLEAQQYVLATATYTQQIYKPLLICSFLDPRIVPTPHFYAATHPWGDNYYGDLYEYPVTSPPATRNNAYCACFDNLHGTVRRRSTKCKHCQKVSSKNNNYSKTNSESTLKKLTKTVQAVQTGSGELKAIYNNIHRLYVNRKKSLEIM